MRLIDADRLINEFEDTIGNPISRTRLKLQVQNQPTIDAVDVVRCGECKNRFKVTCPFSYINAIDGSETDFCSYGERKPMDETKLKPCPFCGTPNTNLYFVKVDAPHGFDTVGIFCNSCKQTVILEENEWEGEDSKTREKAIEAWNRRANDG